MSTAQDSPINTSARFLFRDKQWLSYLAGALLLLPCVVYMGLPALGIDSIANLFSFKKMVLILMAAIGGTVYWHYFRFVIHRPQVLLVFVLALWPVAELVSESLLKININLHARMLLIMGLAIPCGTLFYRYRQALFQSIPWLGTYSIFIGWMLFYSFFFNVHASDPRLSGGDASVLHASTSVVQLLSYIYCLLGIPLAGICMIKLPNYKKVFDTVNTFIIAFSGIEALLAIAGYPLHLFTMQLDGFTRSMGILSHPNPYAHHMGILMIYLLGLFCYYQGNRKRRISPVFLVTAIGLNFIAFLLGLSKTALFAFAVAGTVLMFLNAGIPAIKKNSLKIIIGLTVLLCLGLICFQMVSGKSFWAIIESRLQQTESMNWRTTVWEALLADINLKSVWFGHGFTAANMAVFQATYSDATNDNPLMMVHNAYLALLYDFGIMGYAMVAALFQMLFSSIKAFSQSFFVDHKVPFTAVIALFIYYSIVCGFDETAYMFDSATLFWTTTALWYALGIRESRREDLQPKGQHAHHRHQKRLNSAGLLNARGNTGQSSVAGGPAAQDQEQPSQ